MSYSAKARLRVAISGEMFILQYASFTGVGEFVLNEQYSITKAQDKQYNLLRRLLLNCGKPIGVTQLGNFNRVEELSILKSFQNCNLPVQKAFQTYIWYFRAP